MLSCRPTPTPRRYFSVSAGRPAARRGWHTRILTCAAYVAIQFDSTPRPVARARGRRLEDSRGRHDPKRVKRTDRNPQIRSPSSRRRRRWVLLSFRRPQTARARQLAWRLLPAGSRTRVASVGMHACDSSSEAVSCIPGTDARGNMGWILERHRSTCYGNC